MKYFGLFLRLQTYFFTVLSHTEIQVYFWNTLCLIYIYICPLDKYHLSMFWQWQKVIEKHLEYSIKFILLGLNISSFVMVGRGRNLYSLVEGLVAVDSLKQSWIVSYLSVKHLRNLVDLLFQEFSLYWRYIGKSQF